MQWQAIPRFCNFTPLPSMKIRVQPWKRFLVFAILASGWDFSALAARPTPPPPPPAGGIEAQAAADAAAALNLLNNGKLQEADDAYTALLQRYPTSSVMPEALFRLGYLKYMEGQYDAAVATLNRITAPPASPEIKAAGDALIPQVAAAKASKLSPGDPGRKEAYQDAIKQFDTFIQNYPSSTEVESATYGKAQAQFEIGDYDGATASLRSNLQRFPNSPSILDTEDLMAVILTSQANDLFNAHGDKEAAFGKLKEALGYLVNIIRRNTDVALSNDAQFQIAEVLYASANAEEGEKRNADLSNAILAYRAVKPREAMVQAQQARMETIRMQMQQEVLARNQAAVAMYQQMQDRENAKLEALKNAPDQTLNAKLRIASCYFLLGKYDESRVLLGYLQGFMSDPAQQKQIKYYLVLTYASQGIMDKAETAYNDFQRSYNRDPLGENLPLVMGAAFLTGKNNNPAKAQSYFDQESKLYPRSTLVSEALNQEASAMVGLKKYSQAIATYERFLKTNPPAAQAAAAEQGIAAIYQQTGKLADAVKQYQKVADDFPGTPQAEECAFYAAGVQCSVDLKQALPKLLAYTEKYPNGKFTAQAMMMTGQVQAAQGDIPAAMQTYKDVATKFPNNDFAPQAYFQQAAILGKEGKTDELVALMREFIQKFPDSKDIFYAYDTIGQTQVSKGNLGDAIATYKQMADDHSDNPMAPAALYRTAELWRKSAESQGRYVGLSEAQRPTWNKAVSSSIAAVEDLLGKFPDSDQVGSALQTLLADQKMLLEAQLKKPEDIDSYFHRLAQKFNGNPAAKNRILFTLAAYTYQKDPAKALAEMKEAYNPSLVYAPEDLDLYGTALLDQGKPRDAYDVYAKIAKDYPIPAGAQPAQAPPATQEAQATALFGMASAMDKQGRTADAGRLYAQLKQTYPWSPKVLEANFGIAKAMVQQNKLDNASSLLVGIVGSQTAPASLRAHAFLLIGDIQAQKGNIDAAIDSYLKTAAFYGGVADAAAEGLWKGGQMLEKQADGLTEQSTPKKSDQTAKAVTSYKSIVSQYPDSQFVQKAEDRLKALGAS